MEGGPFKIDADYESILNSSDWKNLSGPFRLGSAR
jgi:hypothetical protein